jgi:hypothetical protein
MMICEVSFGQLKPLCIEVRYSAKNLTPRSCGAYGDSGRHFEVNSSRFDASFILKPRGLNSASLLYEIQLSSIGFTGGYFEAKRL